MVLKSIISLAGAGALAALGYAVYKHLTDKSERDYKNKDSVGTEYDAWTNDGVLEHFWGEHIHHGWFGKDGKDKVDSISAKVILINKLMKLGEMAQSGPGHTVRVLDVGCGIGGSSRHIAKTLGHHCQTVGVTLSPNQQKRAREHTNKSGLENHCKFMVADALALPFNDRTYDYVWALESGEHMPDKRKFIAEAFRVLKPGGKIIMATWCHRNEAEASLTESERRSLDSIYREWSLPFFISTDDYAKIFQDVGLTNLVVEDWSVSVAKTWSQAIADGAFGLPWLLSRGPTIFYRTLRDVFAIWHMIKGFNRGYVRYGVVVATKP